MRINLFSLAVLASLILLITACGPVVIYDEMTTVAESGWSYGDSLTFNFEVPNATEAYDLAIRVEHAEDFPYENFYIKIHTEGPSGARTTERLSLDIAGDFGAWHGDCSGQHCSLDVYILQKTRFQEAGDYRITLEQHSREATLPGIEGMGLMLVKSEGNG